MKGIAWLAVREDVAASVSQAGPSIQFGPAGYWVAALTEQEQQELLRSEPDVRRKWDNVWGDRMTELVMIGIGMEQEQIARELDECLLTDNSTMACFISRLQGKARLRSCFGLLPNSR